jgi:8-amino-7-oxononanoate synthase
MTFWTDDLRDLRRRGLHRSRRRLTSGQGARVRWRGREFVNFSSNDYLDLATDPRLARAAARVARRFGTGAGASPLVSGHLPPLRALERDLADWEAAGAALAFPSGFAANLAVVSTLAGREDLLFSDALNHASLIDGCRLSRARTHIYQHADPDHLRHLLRTHAAEGRRRLIITDSLFSMDGDLAPLSELLDLAERFDCLLVLDEAHAIGVLGEHGRGAAGMIAGWTSERLIRMGTLSKALGSQGGFVCGPDDFIRWLVNRARPYIFSTALAPPAAAAARRAVALVREEPRRRQHVLSLAARLRQQLWALGYDLGEASCHIIPVAVGTPRAALSLSRRLREAGLLVPAIRPPSVPEGTSRLRISLTAGHTEEDVRRLTDALRSG